MNIFLIASIHGKKRYSSHYNRIIELVKKSKNRINADHLIQPAVGPKDAKGSQEHLARHKKIVDDIKKSDAVFAELSYPSTSVGYFVALAASFSKPLVIFFAGDEEPHLFKILDAASDRIAIVRYNREEELETEVPLMIDFVKEVQDTRFNFFVSPSISSYLDWVSKNKRIPRSVYLRRLIDEDLASNDEYAGGSADS